ncbi:patatin-like phospholipase family protein [Spartinivicinus poritis]|uniref:Patatin-like phospholipase family protein n=1 Tax=Spartinivicinus poritis TaxID=2994640 RepID=A0ABT5U6H7_9GAMM|nr:patatin-like phospholipase family protein [Spartinivicinus sp. A2-2]MDE1461157.1 patatin-like phospholipase family protein [Spartinivicinus sp. A2-2]
MSSSRQEIVTIANTQKTVSLVLGSGGARGYAHIGVIEELTSRGYQIQCIAGCSMGALVGGIYAAGKLPDFEAWVSELNTLDVVRLLDLRLKGQGALKGNKVFDVLRDMVGDCTIESLPILYTAVATDLEAQREVWFQSGPLLEAIRASIAIPSIFTPVRIGSRLFVDGGVLNPLPIAPTVSAHSDLIVAVDLSAADNELDLPTNKQVVVQPQAPTALDRWFAQLKLRTQGFRESRKDEFTSVVEGADEPVLKRGMLDIINESLETMQGALTRYKLAAHPPDILIGIPKSICRFYEFHKGPELIQMGQVIARDALDRFEAHQRENGGKNNGNGCKVVIR